MRQRRRSTSTPLVRVHRETQMGFIMLGGDSLNLKTWGQISRPIQEQELILCVSICISSIQINFPFGNVQAFGSKVLQLHSFWDQSSFWWHLPHSALSLGQLYPECVFLLLALKKARAPVVSRATRPLVSSPFVASQSPQCYLPWHVQQRSSLVFGAKCPVQILFTSLHFRFLLATDFSSWWMRFLRQCSKGRAQCESPQVVSCILRPSSSNKHVTYAPRPCDLNDPQDQRTRSLKS